MNSRWVRQALVACGVFCSARSVALGQTNPGPVKVFILAGQSNMEGQGVADLEGKDYNDGKGTLARLLHDPVKGPSFRHLAGPSGSWAVRDDVWVRYAREDGPLLHWPLSVGFSVHGDSHHFGPELQFGWVMGNRLANQVLLIKTAWGGKSLYKDFRPPSSGGEVGPCYKKADLQAFVEKIHASWTIDRDDMAPPTRGRLVSLDPALIVTPPGGLEVGYVPIVTHQEKR